MKKSRITKSTNLIVSVGVVGDSKNGNDVMFAQQADQCGYGRVILIYILCVFALRVQVAALVIARQDAGQHVGAVSLVVEGRLGGENQQMCAVVAPTDLILKEEFHSNYRGH